MALKSRKKLRHIRHMRIRQKIKGTSEIPRFSVYISGKHLYVQFVDDDAGHTLASLSTLDKEMRKKRVGLNCKGAEILGNAVAEKALSAGIKKVIFDRGGFKYHGRIKTLAEAARKCGLEF